MITTLTGENSFALQSRLREITAAFAAEHGDLAVERVDAEEVDFARLREAAAGLPFLAAKKLVVLQSPSANKQFLEKFEQLFDELPETNDLVLIEPKLDKRLAYYKFLKSRTDFQTFPELDTAGLARWLTEAVKQGSGSISPADARYLVERVGANQRLLSNEIDKLLLYNPKITRQSIDLLTEPTPQSTIFELLESAFAKRTKRAMELYDEQRALKVEPQQIVAMLAWQLHVLAVIKTAGNRPADEIAKAAKLNPYVVRKSQGIAKNLSFGDVKKLVSDLLEIDVASKRSNVDTDEALQNYLLKLST